MGQDTTVPPPPDGFSLLEKGKIIEALKAFQAALEACPNDTALLIGAGRAALLAEDYSEAVRYLTQAARLSPDSLEALLYKARAFAGQGRELFYGGRQNEGSMMLLDAVEMFRTVSELDEKTLEPLLEMARILSELYDYEGADAAAREVLSRSPAACEALCIRGDGAWGRGGGVASKGTAANTVREIWQEALSFYEDAGRSNDKESRPHMGMAALYEMEKKETEAVGAYLKALTRDPEPLGAYSRLIAIYWDVDKREELVRHMEALVKDVARFHPVDKARKAASFFYLGYALFINYDYEPAIEAFTSSYKANAEYKSWATYYIARAHFSLNNYDKAARTFHKLWEDDPSNFENSLTSDSERENVCLALAYLSNHSFQSGRIKMARDLLAPVLKVKNDNVDHYNNYAFLCRETGQFKESYAAYLDAIRLDPHNPRTLNDTALILHYHLHTDLDYAKELYTRAVTAAKDIIENESSSPRAKEEARSALKDASDNLQKLNRGISKDG